MTGLRQRQKADRSKRIIAAARELFAEAGQEHTTIEAIAERAGVSGVTVRNYYGTKSGVLLALVAESDRELLDRISNVLPGSCGDVTELTLRFGALIREHAITFLDKGIWRQVLAASITDTVSRFVKSYHALDHQLALVLVREIESLRKTGRAPVEVLAYDLGKALFNLQNMHFINFISVDDMTDQQAGEALRRDLAAMLPAPREGG